MIKVIGPGSLWIHTPTGWVYLGTVPQLIMNDPVVTIHERTPSSLTQGTKGPEPATVPGAADSGPDRP